MHTAMEAHPILFEAPRFEERYTSPEETDPGHQKNKVQPDGQKKNAILTLLYYVKQTIYKFRRALPGCCSFRFCRPRTRDVHLA